MLPKVRLKNIRIRNYRSCTDTSFSLEDDISVLIGPNGSGKTNILNALLLLNNLTKNSSGKFSDLGIETNMRVEFYEGSNRVIHTTDFLLDNAGGNQDNIIGSDEKWYLKDFSGSANRPTFPLHIFSTENDSNRNSLVHSQRMYFSRSYFRRYVERRIGAKTPEKTLGSQRVLGRISDLISGMKYYSATQFTNPKNCPVSFEIEKKGKSFRGIRLRGHAKFLYDLYVARETPEFQEFKEVIGGNGLELIDDIKFNSVETGSIEFLVRSGGVIKEKKQEKMLIVPQFIIGGSKLSPNQLSDGTFKTITLLFYVMTQASSILMIEEPEVCVHHGLLASIIEVIKAYSDDKQIIISTHSDYILDKVSPRSVFMVQNSTNGTQIKNLRQSLNSDDHDALKDYLENEGNLGDYWRHGGLSK